MQSSGHEMVIIAVHHMFTYAPQNSVLIAANGLRSALKPILQSDQLLMIEFLLIVLKLKDSWVCWGKFNLVIKIKLFTVYVIILYRHLEENKVST